MRIACVQSHVVFGDPVANAAKAVSHIADLKQRGVELVLFPEAFLTGYCVDSESEATRIAIDSQSVALSMLREASEQYDVIVVAGYAEAEGDAVYNTAALFEPGQASRTYRKTHLPHLGLDRFVRAGDELPVFETRLGRIGILICFDQRPPEATRTMALQGADLIVLPTNWPVGAEVAAEHLSIARAAENRVFLATCNRVGEENGFTFIGRSKVVHPTGRLLAAAGAEEEVLIADLDFADARQKRTVNIPGKYETEVFASRRPELYVGLTGKTEF